MARRSTDTDPHKLIHVLTGALAGLGIGVLTGYLVLQASIDLLDFIVGSVYVGDATTAIGLGIAALVGIQVGLFCSRTVARFLRQAGTLTSWLFLIALLMFAALVGREAYLRGFLPAYF